MLKRLKKTYKHCFFLLLNLFSMVSYCAVSGDSLLTMKKDTSRHKKIRSIAPAFDFDQRFSFIRNKSVNIWGYREGILVNEKYKVGIGEYFLTDRLTSKKVDSSGTSVTYGKRYLYFGTLYFEPFLWRRKYWELSIPFELGFGKSYFKVYQTTTNIFWGSSTTYFIPSGAGLSLSLKLPAFFGWKPFTWVGINFLAGYRYDIYEDLFNTNYDGAYWSISGAVFLDRVQNDIRFWKARKKARQDAKNKPTSNF